MNFCVIDNPLQHWKTIYPKGKSSLKGFMLKNEKYDICVDAGLGRERGLIALRCDTNEINQRFMFQYIL